MQNSLQDQVSPPIKAPSKDDPKKFADLLLVIKQTPMSQLLTLNNYVDVFDNYNSWRNGQIIEINKNEDVKIRFDGWSAKYDENQKPNSTKVAIFRSHADPYTGGTRTAFRDFKFGQEIDRINQAIQKMLQMPIQGFENQNPQEMCQFLRGDLYFLLDSVLQEQDALREDELKTSLDFIESFLSFIVCWLKHLTTTDVIVDYIDGKNVHANMYYFESNVGIVSCFPEFFDILQSIFFGASPRTKKYFQTNETALNKIAQNDGDYATSMKDKYSQNVAVLSFINFFGSIGGFDRIADLFAWSNMDGDKVKHRVPFLIMKSALPVVEAFSRLLSTTYKQDYLQKLKIIMFNRLENLTQNDLKDSQIKNLFLVMKQVPRALQLLPHIQQDSEQLEVRLALTFIKSGILEKKIRGVKELTDLIERIAKSFNMYGRNEEFRIQHFNETTLSQFFLDERVFDIILNEASNVEVYKRAVPILRFIADQNGLTNDQIDSIWAATQNKHENETKAVLDSIAELCKALPIETLDGIYERILKIPLEEYDSQLLIFIKDFTQNAVANVQSANKNQSFFNKSNKIIFKYEFFGMPLMWDLIQDASSLNTQLMSSAIMSFINCVKHNSLKMEREKYVLACVENLKRQVSVPQSLLVAQHVIDSYGVGQLWKGDASEDMLSKLSKENNIVAMVVSDLERYVRTFEGVIISDPSTQVLQGKIDHNHNIQYRLEFIEYVNQVLPKKMEITIDLFRKLWHSLIVKPLHDNDKQHLLDLLSKSCSVGSKNPLLRDSQIEEIFKTIFCSVGLMPLLTTHLYKSIERQFLYINQKNSSIVQVKSMIKVSKFENIIGLDFFWVVVQYCTKEDIVSQATQTLVNVHLRTEKLSQVDQRFMMWQNFLLRCKDVLRNQSTDAAKGNIIRCLKLLIKGIDGKYYLNGTEPLKTMIKFTVQIGKNENQMRTMLMASNCTLLNMRQQINKEFNLGVQDYELFFQNYDMKLAPESEEDYSVAQIEEARERDKIDIVVQNISSSPYPGFLAIQKFKAYVANNWDIAELLFELLQSASEVYFDDIWEVLTLLPENKVIRQQLEKLQIEGTQEQWNKILHFSCPRKLLYCLQVVENIQKERNQKDKWQVDFLKSRGVFQLLNYYSKLDGTNMAVIFNLKCFASLARLIEQFIKNFLNQHLYIQYFDYLGQSKSTSESDKINNLLLDISTKSFTYILNFFTKSENKQYKDSSTITDFISSLMNLIIVTLQVQPIIWFQIAKKDLISKIIQKGLIDFQDQSARKILQQKLLQICTDQQKVISPYLLKLVTTFFDGKLVTTLREQFNEFLQLLSELLLLEKNTNLKIDFIPQIIDIVLDCSKGQGDEYESVIGYCFKILKAASQASTEAKAYILGTQKLADCLIKECLFQLPKQEGQYVVVARCQSLETRKEGYQLALQLLPGSLNHLLTILEQYVEEAFWRSNSYQDWNIVQIIQQKSRTEFVGLKNLGCICYMNSLMQQLYTLPNFRDSILQVRLEPKTQSVLYQFQLLLSALKSSQKQFYDPRPICNVLGPDQCPINVMEQMDVDEFWSGFMDKLETELKPFRKDLIIKRNFGGLLSNELICKGCPHQSSREELFLALPLQVKNKKNIQDSLLSMTEGEMLEGDNAYFCEKCEKKIPTLMRVCVKKLPNILLLVLKRFEFNYETLTKSKLNDYCEFPMKLDMREYTREYLKSQELQQKDVGDQQDDVQEADPIDLPDYPLEYYEYQLRGIIIHMGTADSGHYYSIIKDGNTNSWFEFNDTLVRPFDINDLAAEAFGSDQKRPQTYSSSKGGMTRDQSRNAYMVFYERVVYVDDNAKPLKNENELNWYFNKAGENDLNQSVDNAQWYNQEILQDNVKFQVNKVMFERSFFEFSLALLEFTESNPLNPNVSQIGKYCLQFFLVVVIRANERKDLPTYIKPLKRLLKNNVTVSASLLQAFCNKDIVLEFLIQNAVNDMKYIVAGILQTAINCVAQNIDKVVTYEQYKKESVNARLVVAWLQYLWDLKQESRKCDQFFRVIYMLSVSSTNSKFYLLRHKTIGRILLYFLDEAPEGAGYQNLSRFQPTHEEQQLPILRPLKKVITDPVVQTSTINNSTNTNNNNQNNNNNTSNNTNTNTSTYNNNNNNNDTNTSNTNNSINKQWDITYNNYTYLVATLSELVYAIGINNNNPGIETNKSYMHSLDDDELALLEDPQVLQRLLGVSYTKRARTCLSNFMQLLIKTPLDSTSYDSWTTTQRLVTAIYQFIKDCDEREVKTGLVCLGKIAAVKDIYEEQRCLLVAEVLLLTLKDGLNYWIYTEIVLDFIIKASSYKSKLMSSIYQVLSNNKSVLKLIENWLKESQNPYNHFLQNRYKVCKKKSPSIINTEITQNLKWFMAKATYRQEQLFKKIMKQEHPDQQAYDSDDELLPNHLAVDNLVDAIYPVRNVHSLCYDFSGYQTWQIVDNIDDMLEVQQIPGGSDSKNFQAQVSRWLHFDDDSLALPLQGVQRHRNHVNFIK